MWLRRLLITAVALNFAANPCMADDAVEYAVKAAYLTKFVPFIAWPESAFETPTSPLDLCILGDDPFGAALDKAVAGQMAADHPLVVHRLAALDPVTPCHILFAADPQIAFDALEAERDKPVVTVTNSGIRAHGIINFLVIDNHVRFDIDEAAAERTGIRISSKLLGLAHAVKQHGAGP